MLIRPVSSENVITPVKEVNFKSNVFKNELYMCPVDMGYDPYGNIIYDVVLISEIVGDIPGANEYDPWDKDNLGKAFGKIIHHFTGRISEGNIDMSNPKEVFANMTLYPQISYVSSFKDFNCLLGSVQFFKYDTKTFTSMIYKIVQKPFGSITNFESELELRRQEMSKVLELDIPNPCYPALRKYDGVPKVATLDTCSYTGMELYNSIPDLKIFNVEKDLAAEEKAKLERNFGIRALLGSSALDDSNENDPLLDRIALSNMARNIAVDFMRADLGGMMESCTLIFDNKVKHDSGLYCGFKSIVSPFGELYPVFDNIKSSYIAVEFDKLCKVIIGVSTPRHYRVSLDCNQFEITVKISILDEKTPQDLIGLYDFKGSVTINMKKSEAISDFITEYLHRQNVLNEYNK